MASERACLPISVVVPARDEALTLPALLASLDAQTALPAEIVVVDAGSVDGTEAVAATHDGPVPVRVVPTGPATPGAARNAGAESATSPWVAFVDAGTVVEAPWLERLWATHVEAGTDVVFASCEVTTSTPFEEAAIVACLPPKVPVGAFLARYPSVPGSLVRRSVVRSVGGFPDLRAGEDMEFLDRLRRAGVASEVAPTARYWWTFISSTGQTFRRYRLYSKHNALAGRQRTWHHGVLRFYVMVLPFAALAVALHPTWIVVPVLLFGLRLLRRLLAYRAERSWGWLLAPRRLAWLALITLVVDMATFAGWFDATRSTRSQP